MAAKVFFLFAAVLVLFEAEATFYRREFFDPASPVMHDLMEDDNPFSRRAMENCEDQQETVFCEEWKMRGYCTNPSYFSRTKNFRTFTEVMCRRTCGAC